MIKTIDGKDYVFKMTRKGIREAERLGMDINELGAKPMTAISYLWFASLYGAQPIPFEKSNDLLDLYLEENPNELQTLFKELSNEYTEVFGLAVV